MITPADIYREIESHPPLMREDVGKSYIGNEVEWIVTFTSGSVHHDHAQLTCWVEGHRPPKMVFADVSLATYPWLKSLPADTAIRMRGRIRAIDAMAITLDIAEISIPDHVPCLPVEK